MISFDYSLCNENAVGDRGLKAADWESICNDGDKALETVLKWRSDGSAAFFNLPSDDELNKIIKKADSLSWNIKDVLVLGIGGSALGLKCISRALLPPYYELDGSKRLFVIDNVDPYQFERVLEVIDWEKVQVVVISKSGRTMETASQLMIVRQKLQKEFGKNWKEKIVAITDPASGSLRGLVNEENIDSFEIPSNLGGRYSVLSPVGLFPAALMGIDIKGLVDGARAAISTCIEGSIEKNQALKWAITNYLFMKKGTRSVVIMPYSYSLEILSDWYSQLWAESLGKSGNGSTPIKAIGTTDQHSQLQLYVDGPKDKFITFITPKKYLKGPVIDKAQEGFEYLIGKGFGDLMSAELEGTAKALAESGCPSVKIEIDTDNMPYSLGNAFMTFEVATALAGALLGINPFDQPGVERGKILAKEILQK